MKAKSGEEVITKSVYVKPNTWRGIKTIAAEMDIPIWEMLDKVLTDFIESKKQKKKPIWTQNPSVGMKILGGSTLPGSNTDTKGAAQDTDITGP